MMSATLHRRIALTAATSAVIGMGLLTGCATTEKPAETPVPSSSSTTAPVSPTEKSVPGAVTPGPQPGSGPKHSIDPGPTALPGSAVTGG